jgi:antitoxin (DNA-binding transcriptional repressor) of toxin-antitoxin stability system
MKRVTISDAKNNLSRHLQYVRRGGRIRILDRDTPVADLVPIEAAEADVDDDDALIASLVRRGIMKPAANRGPIPRELLQPGPRGEGVLEALLDERRRGR